MNFKGAVEAVAVPAAICNRAVGLVDVDPIYKLFEKPVFTEVIDIFTALDIASDRVVVALKIDDEVTVLTVKLVLEGVVWLIHIAPAPLETSPKSNVEDPCPTRKTPSAVGFRVEVPIKNCPSL